MTHEEVIEARVKELSRCVGKFDSHLEGWSLDLDDLNESSYNMQLLGDTLHQKVKALPKDTKMVQISAASLLAMAASLCAWSDQIDALEKESSGFESDMANVFKEVTDAAVEAEKALEEFLLLDIKEPLPIIDVSDQLRSAEQGT